MSLEDKFYPEDGTLATKVDNKIIKVTGKIGEVYQHLTGNSYKKLLSRTYEVAAVSMYVNSICPLFYFIGKELHERSKNPKTTTPLEQKMKDKALTDNIHHSRNLRYQMLVSSIGMMNFELVKHVIKPKEYTNGFMVAFDIGLAFLTIGISAISFTEYLRVADIPKPPPKTVFERAKEKMHSLSESFDPMPEPTGAHYSINKKHYV